MKIALTPLLINLKDKYEMQAQEVANIQRDFSDSINLKEGEGFYDSYFETFGI
jgi:hypothetical protein